MAGKLTKAERAALKKKDTIKSVRAVLQGILLFVVGFLAIRAIMNPKSSEPEIAEPLFDDKPAYLASTQTSLHHSSAAGGEGATPIRTDGGQFIAVSYNGLTISDKLESRIVTQQAFCDQISALHESGYVTITQQDIVDYYLYHNTLPDKAMILIFEDGIYSTAQLAQPALEEYGYIATACTYAQNLSDNNQKYITTENMLDLLGNTYWELGSNGYRLSYINVFDRYKNYFGHLSSDEYVMIYKYLKRDYNHYLMDFLRDEDRLRQESVEEMEERIAYDYEQMRDIYNGELGYVPLLYVLMHANTGAFGNDPLVSTENQKMMTQVFSMNFNRQGSCLNTLESSIYDLTRLQSRHYFATNHLLMRIWDDTGDDVAFVVGDEAQASKWTLCKGVAEYRDGQKIILTSEPYAEGQIMLKSQPLKDVDLSVTLQGNPVGRQSVYLRTDSELSTGVEVALENNELVVRNLNGAKGEEIFRLDLFVFDGGPFVTTQEDEHEGLTALQNAIIQWDTDEVRVEEAKQERTRLDAETPINLEEGGTPYVPDLDMSERDERRLHIQLVGSRLNVWLDDRLAVRQLGVSAANSGAIGFGAGVWMDTERYSQTNLYDDVYDAVFIDTVLTDAGNSENVYYEYKQVPLEETLSAGERILNFITDIF